MGVSSYKCCIASVADLFSESSNRYPRACRLYRREFSHASRATSYQQLHSDAGLCVWPCRAGFRRNVALEEALCDSRVGRTRVLATEDDARIYSSALNHDRHG